jgi:structure-specific recognition protein 1
MRLVIPASNQENENEAIKSEDKMDQDDQNPTSEKEAHNADNIKEAIMKHLNIGSLDEAIAVVQEVPMVTPRGKFDFHFLNNVLKIHGTSFDYKINYKNMSRAFMLPKPDGIHIAFVIALVSPLKQGKTTYPYLVFQIKNNQEKTVELNLPQNAEERKLVLKNEIDNTITGQLYDILAKLVKALIGIRIVIPSNFKR